ncbi:hypothetical protein [Catenulispora acidiphila]|nr:hypothetical protein [Catenulispora acidiphila]
MTRPPCLPDVMASEIRHTLVPASSITAGDTVRHLDMWFEVRSVMRLNGDVCIALKTASMEQRLVLQVPADAQVMTWTTA